MTRLTFGMLQSQLDEMLQANCQLQDQNTLLKAQLSAGATEQSNLTLDQNDLEAEIARLRKDQEDLLELLTDQDVRLGKFKERLRQLGEHVDDEDSDVHSQEESDREAQGVQPEPDTLSD